MLPNLLVAALLASFTISPPQSEDAVQAARAELAAGRPEAALQAATAVLEIDPENVAALLVQGAAHEALGAGQEAVAAYQRALAADPQSGEAYLALGWIYLRGDAYGNAVTPLERARELLPGQVMPRALLAVVYRETGRPSDAQAVLDEALVLEPDNAALWLDAAATRDAAGDVAGALQAVDRAAALAPESADAMVLRAGLLARGEDVAGALAAADRAVQLRPDSLEALVLRAGLLLRAGNTDSLVRAPGAFRRVIELQPESVPAWQGLAEAYVTLAMWEDAEATQRRLLEFGEPRAIDWMNVAFSQARQGKYEEAVGSYTRAIALQPTAGWAWFYRGEALVNLDRQDEGLIDLRRSADILPGEVIPLLVLARTLTERGEAAAADAYLARAAQLQPRNPEVGLEQARSWMQQERYADAIPILRALVQGVPQMNEARYLLGQSLMRSGQADEGRQVLQEYQANGGEQQQARRESVGDRDRVLLVRGRVLVEEGRWEEAVATLRAAADLAPEQRQTWELLLRCYEQLGDQEGAAAARARLAGIG